MTFSGRKYIAILVLFFSVTACTETPIPAAKSTTGRNPTLAEVPDKDENVRGAADPPIVTLDLATSLHEHRLSSAEDLPGHTIIPTINLNAVPITAALQGILSGTDISLSWNTGTLGNRLVTVMNLSGPLPKVVEKVCAAAKVFCDYRHGSIELSDKETFVVSLPPVVRAINASSSSSTNNITAATANNSNVSSNSMIDTINDLLGNGQKAQVDDQGGNIVYTTNVDGEDRVSQYLAQLRTGRPLVVLQMYIWEVTLSRENAQGINWSSLSANIGDSSILPNSTNNLTTLASTAGSVSLGAVTSGIISATAVASFLATKGQVQTISNPQITFVSGTNAELKVGGTQRYISQVGTLTNTSNVSGTNTSSNSNANSSTNTVSTDSIDTGLTIDVAGAYENGVVFANLELQLKNLVSLNPTSSGGGTIDLPQTTDEKMNSVLRVRPGDSLVLAGIVSSADTLNTQGLPTGDESALPLYGDTQRSNHELVMIVKPSIVLFSDKKATEEAQRKENSRSLPDAVVIDKDGSRALAIPQAAPIAAVASAPVASIAPQASVPASVPDAALATPTAANVAPVGATATPVALRPEELPPGTPQAISVSASNDNAPVDRRLMQRGFSHAFDQLLQPQGNVASSGENQ